MKVVAEKYAQSTTRVMPRDGGRPGQHLLAVGRQRHHRFDGLHQCSHAGHVGLRHKHGAGSEQIRAALAHQLKQVRLANFRLQCAPKRLGVQADAKALAVEGLDRHTVA